MTSLPRLILDYGAAREDIGFNDGFLRSAEDVDTRDTEKALKAARRRADKLHKQILALLGVR